MEGIRKFIAIQYDEPNLENNSNITDFPENRNNSATSKFKKKITGQTGNGGTKDVKITVPFKYISNFWGHLKCL